mgnify:CR=1 FL=1
MSGTLNFQGKSFVDLKDAPSRGSVNAPIALVEYSDYECPFCIRHFTQTAPQLLQNYVNTGKVRYFFRDFPIAENHPQAIRAHVAQSGAEAKGWLRALSDPQIGRALALIHERPGDPWTVESLAEAVAMSRSAFAARFSELVEEPPLTYLTRWRMQRASRLLRAGGDTVAAVAAKVGYDAEAAFSKAFKRWMGLAPGAFRRDGMALAR